ncbi:DUF167 domain protein [Rutstroemia sp. NJR-2017a BBW]|nr:DUF167 domain protein [Rutstroemia sp. NJR-2017a BBW]
MASAVRYIAASGKSAVSKILLQCHVKPGASKQREGILAVTESQIEVCVSAQAREGEANKAVRKVLSDIFDCPKSHVEVIKGMKSRDKTVAVTGLEVKGSSDAVVVMKIQEKLKASIQ